MKIGLFSGTFDPFHSGHLKVCSVALRELGLDKVLILLEQKPHRKSVVTPADERRKIIELSIDDVQNVEFFELPDEHVTFDNTRRAVEKKYKDAGLYMIIGDDLLKLISDWPGFADFNKKNNLVVVSRSNIISKDTGSLAKKLGAIHMRCVHESASSSRIKQEIRINQTTDLLNQNALKYILKNKIY